ncbi:MAG TPA: HlyD family type I secretion periplasmic adaptor subunit [Pseudolabrys sp.]|nr:HlyD family type I secretion periplasmic adaptor subunit [Pseudolabrys sp.]
MTWSNHRSHAPEYGDVAASTDPVIGPQGAALICELRRLQKLLDVEREQEHDRFSRNVETRSIDWRPGNRRAARRQPARNAVNFFFGMLGLNRRAAAGRRPVSRSHGKTPAAPKRYVYPDGAKASPQPYIERTNARLVPAPDPARIENRRPTRYDASVKKPALTWLDRADIPPPAEIEKKVRGAFLTGVEFLQSGRAFAHIRSSCAFLVSRRRPARLGETSEGPLTVRLTHGFEDELKMGLRLLFVGVVIVGGWATLVPLSGAVVVPGTLVVESDVKKIQHPTGGVVADIPVRDGMHVHTGDLLLRLDETQLRANYQVLMQQLDQIRVRRARLVAERDGLDEPQTPPEIGSRSSDDAVRRLWTSEVTLFNSRAAARRNAKELLRGHVGQLEEQISGLDAQVKSKAAQRDLISGELEGVDSLYQKGLVPLTRKTSLQREAARLDGDRGQAAAAIAEAKSKISEAELQAVRVDQDFRTEVMKDLREAQDKEAELVEKSVAAQDLLRRVDLRAPTDGIVHQLSIHTVGGVIGPGEVAMEIVPESDELQIEAKLPPKDIDHVHAGQQTYVRFSAFNQRNTPQLEGIVSYVSADLSRDRQANTNSAYYTVRVTLPGRERRRLGDLQLISGMPAEVFLQTGSRTMMSYLLKPITDQLLRTFN